MTTQFKQTMTFFKPLYRDLARRRVPGDMLAGLWMIVDAIVNRNYLYAYDIYMRLAIGAGCRQLMCFDDTSSAGRAAFASALPHVHTALALSSTFCCLGCIRRC